MVALAQRRATQRLRNLVGALVLFLLAAMGLAAFAFTQRQEAEVQRAAAERQARLANVRAWSAAALNNIESDPERGLLLSLQAVSATYRLDRTVLPEAEDALRRSLKAAKLKRRLELAGAAYGLGWSGDSRFIALQWVDPDGKKLLSVWNRAIATSIFTATWDTVGSYVSLSPDGSRVAAHANLPAGEADAAALKATSSVYDVTRGQPLYDLPIIFPTFNLDGTQVVGISSNVFVGGEERLLTFDAATGELRNSADTGVPIADISWEQFSPDAKLCILVLANHDLSVRDSVTGAEVYHLPSQDDNRNRDITTGEFSRDNRRLAVGRLDGSIQIYATEREDAARLVQNISGGELDPLTMDFSPDGKYLAVGGRDRFITIWNVATGRKQMVLAGHSSTVGRLAFSPDGAELLSSALDNSVHLWDVLPGRELDQHFPASFGFTISPKRTHIIGVSFDQHARVRDVAGQGAMLELVGHEAEVTNAAWSLDQRLVATSSQDRTARLWDTTTGKQLATMTGHTDVVFGVALSQDGSRLATGSYDKTARIWDARTGQELLRLEHPDGVNVVLFSRDGRRLYTGIRLAGDVRVWDTATGQLLATWPGHTSSLFGIITSPDGTRLATSSRDGEARVWDAESGAELLVLRGHTGDIGGIDFSPDGTMIATASYDRTVRVWDARSGQVMKIIPAEESPVSVAFTADGSHLIVSNIGGNATIYTLTVEELVTLGRERLTRGWAEAECRQYLQMESCPPIP
jgi:WD40 repeat protein